MLMPFLVPWGTLKLKLSVSNSALMCCGKEHVCDKIKVKNDLNHDRTSVTGVLESLCSTLKALYQNTSI